MQNRYIAVAASMTGGNTLATFIRMIQQWVIQLGVNVPQVNLP
jgi:sedoheptulokinase